MTALHHPRRFAPLMGMCLILAFAFVASAANSDQWKPPADGKFTEYQLKTYLATAKDLNDQTARMVQAVASAKTDADRIAAMQNMDKDRQAVLDAHHITQPEYEWLAQRTMEAWSATTYYDDAINNAQTQLIQQGKDNDSKLADAQSRLTKYQDAQKRGVRIMTDDDRDAAIKSAKSDQQSAQDEAKQHAADADSLEKEAKGHDADAKAADDLASNPPGDVSADDRQSYIDGKKNDAQAAGDAAKDARTREDDAKKAQTDAQSRADAAGQKAAHPEVPITDDDKAAAATDNQTGITTAQNDINDAQQRKQALTATQQQLQTTATQLTKNIPQGNLDLMRKYSDRYKTEFTRALSGGATTQTAK